MKFTKRAMVHSKETRESQKEFWDECLSFEILTARTRHTWNFAGCESFARERRARQEVCSAVRLAAQRLLLRGEIAPAFAPPWPTPAWFHPHHGQQQDPICGRRRCLAWKHACWAQVAPHCLTAHVTLLWQSAVNVFALSCSSSHRALRHEFCPHF